MKRLGKRRERLRRQKKASWRRRAVVGIVAIFLVLGLGAVWRASSGPVSLPFLVDWASTRFDQGALDLKIGAASLDFTGGGTQLILEDSVISVSGTSAADVYLPYAEVDLNLFGFLRGAFEVTGVRLERPKAALRIGSRRGPLPKLQSQVVAIDKFSVLLAEELKRRNLQSVSVANGAVEIDSASGHFEAGGIDAEFEVLNEVSFQIESSLAGEQGRWSWIMRRTVSPETGERSIAVEMDGVAVGDLLPSNVELPLDKGRGTPLYATAEARLTAAGNFIDADLRLRTGRIKVHLTEADVNLDEVFLNLNVQRDERDIFIGRSYAVRGQTRFVFGGSISPPVIKDGEWTFSLGSREAVVAPSDVNAPPIVFIDSYIDGRLDLNEKTVFVDAARAQGLDADLSLAGSFYFGDGGPFLALALASPSLSAAQVLQLWPVPVVPKTRHWLVEHIKAGRVENIHLDLGLGPSSFDGNPDNQGWVGNAVTASFDLKNAALATLDNLPIASQLNGRGRIENETLIVEAKDGVFRMQDGNLVDVTDVTYKTLNLALRPERSHDLAVTVAGDADDLGVLVNAEPFRALDRIGLVPSDLQGHGTLLVSAAFPVKDDITFADVDWNAELKTEKFSSSRKIGDQLISDADLVVKANKDLVTIEGDGKLNGLQAKIDLESPMDGVEGATRQGIVLDATAQALAEQGIDLREFLQGPLQIKLTESEGTKVYSLDLTRTQITLGAVGWRKEPGVRAQARFRMLDSDGGKTIHNFSLSSDGVSLRGNAKLTSSGDLEYADFSEFNLRPNDDVALSIRRDGRRGYMVNAQAARLDGRGFLKRFTARSATGDETGEGQGTLPENVPIKIALQLRDVTGFNGILASRLDGTVSLKGDEVTTLDLQGRTSERNPFSFSLGPKAAGKVLNFDVHDAGELLKFTNVFRRMRGGRSFGAIEMPEMGRWQGQGVIKHFSITEDPAIRALAKARPRNSSFRRGRVDTTFNAVAQSGEASFNRMTIEFNRVGDVVNLTKGVLEGALIGGTVEGQANIKTRQLDMTGTFVPAYTLNNFLAKVPILGLALGGDKGDAGLFGVTYKMTGSFDEPNFTINPVSAIAPGIFRRIFEFD